MSKPGKTHGLNGTWVEPDWLALTKGEIGAVLAQFGLNGGFRVLSVSPRPLSAGSLVEVGGRQLFIKRHARAVRDGEALREEHRFMDWLRAHGAAVPEVLRTVAGDTVQEVVGWTYEVHAAAEGVDAYGDAISWTPFRCADHAREAGFALASLHAAAEGFDAPSRSSTRLVAGLTIYAAHDTRAATQEYLARWPILREFVTGQGWIEETLDLLMPFAAELAPLREQLLPLWTHNDLHASNLFWSDTSHRARATAVIDFGLCDRTNAVHDIANAIERNCVEWLTLMNAPETPDCVAVHMDQVWMLLEGYESVRKLTAAEIRALAPMLAVCHVEFALSEAEYYMSALHSPQRAKVACDDYMVGHARWWRGPGGRMLDELRAWAGARA